MALEGQHILVTGASGFIGGAVVARLVAEGARVRGLVRSAEKGAVVAGLGAEPVLGDLTDADALRRAVQGCAIVLNVGAALGGSAATQSAVNVTAVGVLAEIVHAAGVRRLVHISSIAAYGYGGAEIVTEDTPLRPGAEHYGQSKALGETRLRERCAVCGLPYVIIRPGMVYGPRSGFWTRKMAELMNRTPAMLPGEGETPCPVIYIGDLVDLIVVAAEHPNAAGQVFNGVSDPPPTWRQFLGAYAAMAGRSRFIPIPIPVLRGIAPVAEIVTRLSGEPQPVGQMIDGLIAGRRVYSMAKAARLLDWRPRVGLDEGMAQAAIWLREVGLLER